MPNTKFHCGDAIIVTDFSRYCSGIKDELQGKILPIVGIHPINVHGEISFTDPEIQYLVPAIKPGVLDYYALVGSDLDKVENIDYRSIFGKFRYSELRQMLFAPDNAVEEYMFRQCRKALSMFEEKCKISDNSMVSITNKVQGSKDYFSGISKGNCIRVSIIG